MKTYVFTEKLGPVFRRTLFYFGVCLLKLNSRKKGTLITHGLLENLEAGGPSLRALRLRVPRDKFYVRVKGLGFRVKGLGLRVKG